MARPRVYTNEELITGLTEMRGLVYLAARKIGCGVDTIYRRARVSPAVAAVIKQQRGELVDTAELSLYNAILRGEAWAVSLALKTLGKDRGYSEVLALEGGQRPIEVRLVRDPDFYQNSDRLHQLAETNGEAP
jgi:hypothetical protein